MKSKSPARNWLLRYGSLSLENDLNSHLFTHNLTPATTPHWKDQQQEFFVEVKIIISNWFMDKKSRELLQTWYFWSPVMLDGAWLHFGSRTFNWSTKAKTWCVRFRCSNSVILISLFFLIKLHTITIWTFFFRLFQGLSLSDTLKSLTVTRMIT